MMRKLSKRKSKQADGEVQELRLKMAKEALAATKVGDISKCDPKNSSDSKN